MIQGIDYAPMQEASHILPGEVSLGKKTLRLIDPPPKGVECLLPIIMIRSKVSPDPRWQVCSDYWTTGLRTEWTRDKSQFMVEKVYCNRDVSIPWLLGMFVRRLILKEEAINLMKNPLISTGVKKVVTALRTQVQRVTSKIELRRRPGFTEKLKAYKDEMMAFKVRDEQLRNELTELRHMCDAKQAHWDKILREFDPEWREGGKGGTEYAAETGLESEVGEDATGGIGAAVTDFGFTDE